MTGLVYHNKDKNTRSFMKVILAVSFLLLGLSMAAVSAAKKPLEVVSSVDLQRYLGTWYEIATIPSRFQKDCVGVTATYTLRPDGDITVVNTCLKKTLEGEFKSVKGKAWVVDKTTNAKLKVRFFWPFSGDYWIIELDPDYQWAVVGDESRNYLWILCRTLRMDESLYQDLLNRVTAKGFDVNRLKRTLQPEK
jgi:apolipoprotein D and lipocalin family protein